MIKKVAPFGMDAQPNSPQDQRPTALYQNVRVKSTEFLLEPATAVYFYDITDQVSSWQLEYQIEAEKQRN